MKEKKLFKQSVEPGSKWEEVEFGDEREHLATHYVDPGLLMDVTEFRTTFFVYKWVYQWGVRYEKRIHNNFDGSGGYTTKVITADDIGEELIQLGVLIKRNGNNGLSNMGLASIQLEVVDEHREKKTTFDSHIA